MRVRRCLCWSLTRLFSDCVLAAAASHDDVDLDGGVGRHRDGKKADVVVALSV